MGQKPLPGFSSNPRDGVSPGAVISDCGRYRYVLTRCWGSSGRHALFVLLNPSTADDRQDDATLRRIVCYASRWGYDGLVVVNLFAWRSTDPAKMKAAKDPIGTDNNHHIREQAKRAAKIVLGYGDHGNHLGRDGDVMALLEGYDLFCLGTTKSGRPKHPLRLAKDTPLEVFD